MKCDICGEIVYRYKVIFKDGITKNICYHCYKYPQIDIVKKQGGVVAIMYDDKGNSYAVDKCGRHVPKENHPYNLKTDKFGWKYTGKTRKDY